MKKTIDQITREVRNEWGDPEKRAYIRRNWPDLTEPAEIQTAEMRRRWYNQFNDIGGEG